jgi:hypothetical protein
MVIEACTHKTSLTPHPMVIEACTHKTSLTPPPMDIEACTHKTSLTYLKRIIVDLDHRYSGVLWLEWL